MEGDTLPGDVFELISQGFRYWFVLLGAVIVWRAFRWSMLDHKNYRRTMRALPDAGFIGEVVDLNSGKSQSLPREGVIGSGKGCDIRLSGIRNRECEYSFVDGKGVEILPVRRAHELSLDGERIGTRAFASHGSRLNLPGYSLRFRLFSGLNVPVKSHEYDRNQYLEFVPDSSMEELSDAGMPLPDQLPGLEDQYMPQYGAEEQASPVADCESSQQLWQEPASAFVSSRPALEEEHRPGIPEYVNPQPQAWNPDITWKFAVPPPETFADSSSQPYRQPVQPVWEQEMSREAQRPRKRRSQRHEEQ